ncbi:MAG TPA: tetratricopeptide repeat protein [Terriglobales bacterium]|nr:tetratricopeptide repeat protein [Terriglobales bacterium]
MFCAFLLPVLAAAAPAQFHAPTAQTIVVMPFENQSHAPGLEWISEAFPEVIGQRLRSPSLFVMGREERLYAFDRLGVPAGLRLSRATMYRIAEEMDADYAVLGSFNYDGQTFSATAQVLAIKGMRLFPPATETGPLLNILEVQSALAWNVLRVLEPETLAAKNSFVAAAAPIRLDALENYVRGVTATERAQKLRYLREAVRLNAGYTAAILQLGKAYFAGRDYENAALWLAKTPRTAPQAGEAAFFEGLADYYLGAFDKAEAAFTTVAARLPLTEVCNNLGVVTSRRGKHAAALDYFQKAVQADPNDPDYRFNLAVALFRNGDTAGASRQLREALARRPGDSEAKAFLDSLSSIRGPEPAAAGSRVPLERIKRNYDEVSFRQMALEMQNAAEARMARTDPATHAAFHVERGRQFLADGFLLEAEQQFREAVMLNPANAAAHLGWAAALEKSDAARSRSEALAAVRLQPSAEAYLILARLDLRDNRTDEAAANVARALELEPANAAALTLQRAVAARQGAASAATPQP